MNKIFINTNFSYSILVALFSFFFNYYYGKLGVFPIDTFAFFDTAYNILIDRHPFRDIWITTGPAIDYLQAIFFKIFGLNWTSYVIHSSLLNSLISVYFYLTLVKLKLNRNISLIYSLGFGALCYTVSGTPFAYLHSYSFSLLAILIFFRAIKFESKISFFFLPITMCFSFFCMQNPSTFINLLIIIFLIIFIIKKKNFIFLRYFFYGGLTILLLTYSFISINEIPLINIYEQYILFPLSLGEYRVTGSEMAHFSLSDRMTFRNIFGHFKFIDFFLILLLYFAITNHYKKKISYKDAIIYISLFCFGVAFIFNQLITSNQTYIFSLIPFIGGFLHICINQQKIKHKKYQYFIVLIMIFTVCKYHFEYNVKRKFMDMQNVDLSKAIDAKKIDLKLKGLKWISPKYPNNPEQEIELLKETIISLRNEKKNKMIITDYQFLSLLLEENLNIPNRWYTNDNNSYPMKNHKYFKFYKNHFDKIIKNEKIEIIYLIGAPKFENHPVNLKTSCYTVFDLNKITKMYKLKNCL